MLLIFTCSLLSKEATIVYSLFLFWTKFAAGGYYETILKKYYKIHKLYNNNIKILSTSEKIEESMYLWFSRRENPQLKFWREMKKEKKRWKWCSRKLDVRETKLGSALLFHLYGFFRMRQCYDIISNLEFSIGISFVMGKNISCLYMLLSY